MTILTNDDGYGEPGLQLLQQIIPGPTKVVAPSGPKSCCGHQITISEPISLRREGADLVVGGSPADCVRLAVLQHPECAWVVSGVNPGANLGLEAYNSGTVAAAREAAIQGRSAIAVSTLMRKAEPPAWDWLAPRLEAVLANLMRHPLARGYFWNVNFPPRPLDGSEPEIVHCPASRDPLDNAFEFTEGAARYAGNYHGRAKTPGTDVWHCFQGRVAVSLLAV
jgi:5'-nucleotidase